jgi:UDP-N-acetylglucosamine--N-acetylmuramyl-(pentapeptide) pyrophosphoryl-undecaprenol N-acetylglucosamine transferase
MTPQTHSVHSVHSSHTTHTSHTTHAAHQAHSKTRTALITAGGTGGHIFPGLALAQALQDKGWQVHWVGTPQGMEARFVPQAGLRFHALPFEGLRAKGIMAWLRLPRRLLQAWLAARQVIRTTQPDVVIGFGGYVTVPVGLAAWSLGRPLVIHEQNAVAGWGNRILARLARGVFTAFPSRLPKAQCIGMPLRSMFENQPSLDTEEQAIPVIPPDQLPPLRILVLGGSQGAQALNRLLPQAIGLLPDEECPVVVHQSGEAHLKDLRARYTELGLDATCLPFIEDVAQAMRQADLVIARAGAGTVWEVISVGVAALFIPLPHAVDDHQTRNAAFLVDQQAAWCFAQARLSPATLAKRLLEAYRCRHDLQALASRAHALARPGAAAHMAAYCESLLEKARV